MIQRVNLMIAKRRRARANQARNNYFILACIHNVIYNNLYETLLLSSFKTVR